MYCPFPGCLDHLGDVGAGHGPATLAREHEGRLRILLPLELTQGPQFIALDRMHGSNSVLKPSDVQVALGEVYLVPMQVNCLSDPQAVPCH